MKKLAIISLAIFGFMFSALAQNSKVEILYFKAALPCCAAKACNDLEGITKTIIEKNFTSKEVTFKTIKLAEKCNKELVAKYNAKSQTVVMVNTKTKKSEDISSIVAQFARNNDEKKFETALVEKLKAFLK